MAEVISVTELNTRVRDLFSKNPSVNDVWVGAEISNLKKYPSGYYFVLKDQGSEIHAVLFNNARSRVEFEPQENMKVRAFGSIGMYVPRGTYQFIVETMEKSGLGDRYLAFEALKKKLGEEGLFSQEHKRQLPAYPKKIGVVTSQSGAVIHDIITTSASRYPADIYLAPAMVQGDGAAQTIVAGIKLLNRFGVDVIIVGRGGGSIEDLWPFNEEIVARAIYESKAPVVSAVGHETDFTISDFVSDRRAPTPTGAAAIILRDRNEIEADMHALMRRLDMGMRAVTDRMRHSFDIVDSKLDPSKQIEWLNMCRMRVDERSSAAEHLLQEKIRSMRTCYEKLDLRLEPQRALQDIADMRRDIDSLFDQAKINVRMKVEGCRSRFVPMIDRPDELIQTVMKEDNSKLESYSRHMEGLNPLNVLNRGYGMITSADGKGLTGVGMLESGDAVKIHFRDGSAEAEIKSKEMKR